MTPSGIVFFDDADRNGLFPLTYTRPMSEIRIGILTIREKWCKRLEVDSYAYHTDPILGGLFKNASFESNLFIKGNVLPIQELVEQIKSLSLGQHLYQGGELIVACLSKEQALNFSVDNSNGENSEITTDIKIIRHPEQIFMYNEDELLHDFELVTQGRVSAEIDSSNQIKGTERIFVEEGAVIEHSILNAEDGPIYVGKEAKILDGCMLKNGVALGNKTVLKMGAKIYGPTTIGPGCKVGGEVKNAVIFGNSNKSHDGYLGNAVVGEWCNLGADTNASNMKNDYSEVKLWDYTQEIFRKTGTQFCGLVMGDHSKTGINTMFNTGTVVGVSCNIFGAGFQKNFIPSFSWGGPRNYKTYRLEKAIEVASVVWGRRQKEFTSEDRTLFETIYQDSANYRK